MFVEPILIILFVVLLILPATIGVIMSVYIGLKNQKQIQEVHLAMNSRFDQWMSLVETSSFARGYKSKEDEIS